MGILMLSFGSILWPTNFDACSRAALRAAANVLGNGWRDLAALTVLDPLLPQAAALAYNLHSFLDDYERELYDFTGDALAGLPLHLRSTTATVAVGKPHQEILRVVRTQDPDLVILGVHGRQGIARLLLGSTSASVLRVTPAPVFAIAARDYELVGDGELATLGRGPVVVVLDCVHTAEGLLQIGSHFAQQLAVPLVATRAPGAKASIIDDLVRSHEGSSTVCLSGPWASLDHLCALVTSADAGLVVTARPEPHWLAAGTKSRPYSLAARSGRPVLVLPEAVVARVLDSLRSKRAVDRPTAA